MAWGRGKCTGSGLVWNLRGPALRVELERDGPGCGFWYKCAVEDTSGDLTKSMMAEILISSDMEVA
jgi:hypothetical protein